MKRYITNKDIENAWDNNMELSHKNPNRIINKGKNKYEIMKLKVKKLLSIGRW